MRLRLTPEEEQVLAARFRYNPLSHNSVSSGIKASDLLHPGQLAAYLQEVSQLLRSPSRVVTASQFSKRYSYLVLVPALYAMSRFNKLLPLWPGNVWVESSAEQGMWLPKLKLRHGTVLMLSADREVQRTAFIRSLFAEHVTKVWTALNRLTGISPAVLWENTALYVIWLYEQHLLTADEPDVRQRAREDFQSLLTASAALFGTEYNPLAQYWEESGQGSDGGLRQRKTCCYYYRLPGAKRCQGCPCLNRRACNSC
ncbi:siderophore-iron reductase FhuF [Caldalkalibacillus uzonensis]|uniref:Siderophore-iron reductase FhuF n=1 Tax=Caldalkalibacillus uzonensis TaxID=353224 RepID=A0ABU0CQ39_9BACI|nr:siderophore-iron reductase FhuF [Caldalkalibacillus uzonensis]MDQ0338489.1 siderophore-iron reductase FhuF [Caldalkalibacillus uzonensis]